MTHFLSPMFGLISKHRQHPWLDICDVLSFLESGCVGMLPGSYIGYNGGPCEGGGWRCSSANFMLVTINTDRIRNILHTSNLGKEMFRSYIGE